MDNEFDIYSVDMDSETINIDFDDIDLFGERTIDEDYDTDIEFE